MSTRTLIRLSKAILSLSISIFAGLVVFNNITDYWTNFHFVEHVMRMDTTFPDSTMRKRAMTSKPIFHATYALIIVAEAMIAWLCASGAWAMSRAIRQDGQTFHEAKRATVAGLLSGILLWFTGFQVVAGEWFGMWMSKEWDGMASASRLTQIISASLIFISMKNDE